jgi:hypothetical protein
MRRTSVLIHQSEPYVHSTPAPTNHVHQSATSSSAGISKTRTLFDYFLARLYILSLLCPRPASASSIFPLRICCSSSFLLTASYIPALHSLIECLPESVAPGQGKQEQACVAALLATREKQTHFRTILQPAISRTRFEGCVLQLLNLCVEVHCIQERDRYKKETISDTRCLAHTILAMLPCECTAPTVAPTVPLPAVSLPSVSRPPHRVHTRRRPRRSPRSRTNPRRTTEPCRGHRRRPWTCPLLVSEGGQPIARVLTTSLQLRS